MSIQLQLDEQKQLIKVHIKAQGIPQTIGETILQKIKNLNGVGEGSWIGEFCRAAEEIGMKGEEEIRRKRWNLAQHFFFQAATLHCLARFPFPTVAEQEDALRRSINYFNKGAALAYPPIQSVDIPLIKEKKKIHIYLSIPETKVRIPIILASGGIVSHKEQWYKFLNLFPRLGFATCVMDGPGVGESPFLFRNGAEKNYLHVINHLASQPHVDPDKIILLGISFGGYWAIKVGAFDKRVKGIIAIAAPIHHFFSEDSWWNQLPITTKETLKFVTGVENEDMLKQELKKMSLEQLGLLKTVNIPILYFGSTKDSICPLHDAYLIRERIKTTVIMIYNDEHAIPNHLMEVWLSSIHWLNSNFLVNRWFQKRVVASALSLVQLINFFKNLRRLYL